MEWMQSIECREVYLKIINVLSKASSDPRVRKMDSHITGMWTELQKENKLPKGVLTVTCEKELQDLMKQIDIMVAGKKRDWEIEKEGFKSRLTVREKECNMQKSTLELKHKEIGHLRQQVDSGEKKQRDYVSQYESQLSQLKSELLKLQREYERLHKRHAKQKKDAERERERSVFEVKEGATEIERLSSKLEEYRQRSKDWELEKRGQHKQIESLESQRKAISEKCEFVQQQSQTYQAQLDKRRQILDSTELSLNSQICQLEGKLSSTTESLQMQTTKVEKLKASLEEAMNAHKKAMDDNERLLGDLKKANTQLRKSEELNRELQTEMRARDDFLQMSEEDSRQHAHTIVLLERQIGEKDEIIKTLGDTRSESTNEEIHRLKSALKETQEKYRACKKSEAHFSSQKSHMETELKTSLSDCQKLKSELEQKRSEMSRLERDMGEIKSKLTKVQCQLSTVTDSHEAELQGMKLEMTKVTTELHGSNNSVGAMTEKTAMIEKQLNTEQEQLDKRNSELNVANAQIDALRLENRHLRQTIIQQTQYNLDHTQSENSLRDMQENFTGNIKSLEEENKALKDDVTALQRELTSLEDRYEEQLQSALHEAELSQREESMQEKRHRQEVEEDASRQVNMIQDRLDSTIHRYEEQLAILRRQKHRLEEDVQHERNTSRRYNQSLDCEDGYYDDGEDGVIYHDDSMSLTGSVANEEDFESDTHTPRVRFQLDEEMPGLGESASEKFLQEEEVRAKELESLIDNHIEKLKTETDKTLQNYIGKR